MDLYAASLIGQYRRSGVLVDTNLLLLTFVGAYDRSLVARFKRTADRFAPEDFDTLAGLLRQFATIVTTPHILTEVSNLLGNLSGQARTACFELFAGDVRLMREQRTPGAVLSNSPAFVAFGIADTSILDAASGACLVLTDDLTLSSYLQRQGVDVLNFNNIRTLGY